jgi:transcriptional regulator with XRE-family HTH domain
VLHDRSELKRRRIGAGLSQRGLAVKAGLHPTYIYALERGRRFPTPATLAKLAKVLRCKVADLLADDAIKPSSNGDGSAA